MGVCAHPDCTNPAPHGFRKPGLFSEQTVRGYLWVCSDHIEWAEARRNKAMGVK